MKLKNWVLWLCIAVLLAGAFFLFKANLQRDAALVQLREVKQEAGQLRAQLDQLKNSSVATLSTENARLRAENQGFTQKFPQLQAENNRLHEQNRKLTQQLETAHSAAQQQQEQLQQIQTENQQANTAPEPSAEQQLSAVTQLNTCINNLRQIDAAKQEWALEKGKKSTDTPTMDDLKPYLRNIPHCPAGGAYTINAAGQSPECSIPDHKLP